MRSLGIFFVGAYLVAQALGGDDGDFIADSLVGLEVEGQLGIVPLNDDLGGLLDCLGANATHFGDLVSGLESGWVVVGRFEDHGQEMDFFWR